MDRKPHHVLSKHGSLTKAAKETGAKVEKQLVQSHQSSQASGSQAHHQETLHAGDSLGLQQASLQLGGHHESRGHHLESSQASGLQVHHQGALHMGGSLGLQQASLQLGGSHGHHESLQASGSQVHQGALHVGGSLGLQQACLQLGGSHGHHESRGHHHESSQASGSQVLHQEAFHVSGSHDNRQGALLGSGSLGLQQGSLNLGSPLGHQQLSLQLGGPQVHHHHVSKGHHHHESKGHHHHESKSHHFSTNVSGSEGHHDATLTIESVSHHDAAQINGSTNHQEVPTPAEPIRITPSIGGFFLFQTKEKLGIYQALQKKVISEDVALAFLEAQAATGNIINLSNNQNLTVEAAIQQGIVGPEFEQKLLLANSAVTGYKHKEETISTFQAFKRGLISKIDAARFLQAQVATGGIIDHVSGKRVPVAEALNLNYIDESFLKTLTGQSAFSRCYPDPNTKEESTYQELTSKSFTDSESGLLLLTIQESLQGLRRSVNLEELFRANIITQLQYNDIREGRLTIQQVGELQEVRQYLIGLSSVGGVYIESTKERLSLYQALKRNIVPFDWAVALLEAQAASGFMIEPEQSRTFTVTEAIQEGLVGLELKEKLLNAERAVTGFTDPYTGGMISLFQAMKKEMIDRNLGLNLLGVQLATGGIIDPFHSIHVPLEVALQRGLLDEATAKLLSANDSPGFLDLNSNDRITYRELRQRASLDPNSNTYLVHLKLAFQGVRGKVTSDELLDSQIIDQPTYDILQQGQISIQDVAEQGTVKHYLQGTGLITGVAVLSTNEIKSVYQAMKEHLLMPGTSIALLEAQAATGYLIDPVKNLKFSVDEAVKNGLIGPELYEKLLSAEKASTGYRDPISGERLSLYQAMNRGFVTRDHGIRLLDVQLSTGGIIDPSKKHRLPQEVAYKRGYLHDDTYKVLLDQAENIKGFFDPNLKENLTYGQVQQRSLIDLRSGLLLIPVFENVQNPPKPSELFVDYKTKMALDGIKITLTFGRFKGFAISLWQLLFSEYFSIELRQFFIQLYKAGSLSADEFSGRVEAELKQLITSTKVTFKGLRETVTPGQLLESEIIDKNLFNKLQQGEASAKDVVNIDTVKKYLQGTGSIAGLILTDTQEKISIYQAKRKGLLRPGTSLILLEAQAATGYIIDPVQNEKYSVNEALKANLIGPEYYEKLLSAEKSVTGYKDPYTGDTISLFQAMSRDLIVSDHGIRLLEAQIATGGIIDPINSHRIPVEVAYKRGYFDKKMNLVLSDPSDDTKGFFDPNTSENLTYLQLKERCINDPSSNLCLLPLISTKRQLNVNDYIRDSFRNVEIYVRFGRFKGQTMSIWTLINSEYFSEWRRRELLEQYRRKKLTIEQIILIIEEEVKKWTKIQIPTLRGEVNIYELLEYEIIDRELFEQVLEGKVTAEQVFRMETVGRYLQGSGVLGGIIIQPSNEKISFYEASKKNMLLPSTVLPLLEAQAATGYIVDPENNRKLSVDEALKAAIVDPQIYERLSFAEEAVRGYQDPFTGGRISLFQAMRKGLVDEKHARQLLEAQMATGGVIDPVHGFHLPVSAAKKHGYLSEELLENLSSSTEDTKSFYDPSTKEKVTYSELLRRSQKDESAGIYLLPLPQDFQEVPVQNIYSDEEVQQIFKTTRVEERNVSIWELIHSGYFTEEERYELLETFKAKKLTVQELIIKLNQMVKDNEIKKTTHITFQGLRGQVPVVWLLDLGIISQQTFNQLIQGLKSVEEVSQLPEVKGCLNGTGVISGVFLPSTNEKLSIYQALRKNLLLPANALMLLEAQAATGFIIDPKTNNKYTVDGAVKAGVVGPELHEKLITAESAVTGYADPYTGNKISLGQAIEKKLILQKEGAPLLQAQMAAGGIIDTLHGHFIPIQLAYKLGYLNEEISKARDLPIYIDPNTKESVSYQQLKERCYTDPNTGSLLLPLSDSAAFYAEGHLIEAFKSFMVTVSAGRYKDQTVSLWELLNSEYINTDRLKEFIFKYKTSSSEALQELIRTVTTVIEETDAASTQIKFKGLRKQISASDLFQSEVIDQKTLNELNLGKKTIDEVTEMESVRNYLEGTNCIAGVLLQSTNTKMSIYDAMLKRILRPGTALVLLEAQAATGFIIDPVKNEKLSVDEAHSKGIIGHDIHAKLLSAEQAVTGYTDPYNGDRLSLFQAMQKNLIVDCHGIRLLEAQIATGGIIDPVHSHRIPVEVAYKRGYFSEEMNRILSDPSDDTKGFFDPNTHENLTYLQLVERCIQDPETGLYLLQVVKKGENYFYITDNIKADLQSRIIHLQLGRYSNQTVSIWQILTSHYITDQKRRQLVRLYMIGVLSIEQLISNLTTIIEEYEAKGSSLKFKAIRGEVSATDLYNAEIIDEKTLNDLKEGRKSVEAISQLGSVRRYLKGTSSIAGVLSLTTNETLSINEAVKRGLLSRDIGLLLLQAQAATGHLTDPVKNQVLSISDALSQGLADADIQGKLEIAEKAVIGFTDPESGNRLSIFQAIQKGILPKEIGISFLDAQLATGGIVDPVFGHRLPLQVAYKRGYLDEDFYLVISDAAKKGFVDPNTHERITYKDLLERCVRDPTTGLYVLQLAEKSDEYFYIDELTRRLLTETSVKVNSGKFKGQDICLWDLLTSAYISKEKRKELLKVYKTNTSIVLRDIASAIQSIIEEKEKGQNDFWFQGLRKQVTAAELLDAGIINQETLDSLKKDLQSVSEVSKLDSVKQYLEGTSCIAGVLIPSLQDPNEKKKLNIYDAMLRRVLRPGTALILLEAQAATGFIVDAIQNRKLSVNEALVAGVIGHDIYDKLRCAEKAVTGYTDPYTGDKISLFQAMLKDLIIKEHGIRLLEAQIATGGIIDPVHSHRVPVEVAYKRGYFDEDLNQILSDPTDDTKGFFDPNSHENLTYLQLLQRCTQDPDTGLYMLELKGSKFSSSQIQNNLQSRFVMITLGEFQGRSISIWELINSKYFSAERRQELLKKLESGLLTIEEMFTMTIKVINETEQTVSQASADVQQTDCTDFAGQETEVQASLQLETVLMSIGTFKGQSVSVWELLHSHYISQEKRLEILQKIRSGALSTQEVISILITVITEAEIIQKESVKPSVTTSPEQPIDPHNSISDEEIQNALLSITIYVTKGQYAGQELSLWDLLNSKYIPEETKQELIGDYKLTVQDIMELVVQSVRESGQGSRFKTEYNLKVEVYNVLQMVQIEVTEGEFKGQKHSVWYLLNSKYLSEERRQELLENFNSGTLVIDELIRIIITLISETEERSRKLKFKGLRRQVTATELLTSEIIDQNTLRDLAQGRKTVEEVTQMDNVKRYLEGTSCIAGLLVPSARDPSKKDKISIYNAMLRNILRPGTALVLLEAQAATGFIIDPVNNKKLSVDEAAAAAVIGQELHKKLLSAEKAVTGYTDPYTGDKISLFQAMQKDLIVKDHGIRLLEAQIATGGIIDPVHSHRVPVQVAYKRGYFDEEINQILSDPTDDTKGFFDPNSHENLTYLQLVGRCVQDPDTGLSLLEIKDKKALPSGKLIETSLKKSGQTVNGFNLEEAIQDITEESKKGLLQSQSVDITKCPLQVHIIENITRVLTKDVEVKDITLTDAVISSTASAPQSQGKITESITVPTTDVEEKTITATETVTITKQSREEIIKTITDVNGRDITVTETVVSSTTSVPSPQEIIESITVHPENITVTETVISNITSAAEPQEESIEGLTVPTTEPEGKGITFTETVTISTCSAPKPQEEVIESVTVPTTDVTEKAINVTETVTVSTASAPKPQQSLQLDTNEDQKALSVFTVHVAEEEFQGKRASLWEVLHSNFVSEDSRKAQLRRHQTTIDKIKQKILKVIEDAENKNEIEMEKKLQQKLVDVNVGEFRGQSVSVWFLLQSRYITEEQRNELLQKYKAGVLSDDEIFRIIITIIEETERSQEVSPEKEIQRELEMVTTELTLGELQGQKVSVWFLLFSKYISEEKQNELLHQYTSRTKTAEDILKILITIIEETEQRRELKFKGLRRQVTASELLQSEIIDQSTLNELTQGSKTVEEVTQMDSVKRYLEGTSSIAGVFVTSKTDPTKRDKLTIYDAMFRRILRPGTALILLEAQAATGFVIDPIQNKKLSVEEARAAGLIGHEIYDKLLSAERGVTGYNDPYTGQKISLFQAMKKDLIVKDHGIRLLEAQIATGGIIDPVHSHRVPVEVAYKRGYFDEEMNQILSDPSDDTRGFFDPNTHENLTYLQLLQRCIQDPDTGLYMLDVKTSSPASQEELRIKSVLQSKTVQVTAGEFQGRDVTVWNLLYSRYVSVEKRQELLSRYRSGSLTIEELITILLTFITETEELEIRSPLQSRTVQITTGEFQGKDMSIWDLLYSRYVSVEKQQDLLNRYRSGSLTIEELITILLTFITETEVVEIQSPLQSRTVQITTGEFQGKDMSIWDLLYSRYVSGEKQQELLSRYRSGSLTIEELITILLTFITKTEVDIKSPLQSQTVQISTGEFQGKDVSVWDLLHSRYVSVEKREELLSQYRSGSLTIEEIITIIISFIMEEELSPEIKAVKKSFLSVKIDISIGNFQEKSMSLWDLLHSKYIPEDKRAELIEKFRTGTLNIEEIINIVLTTIQKYESESQQTAFVQEVKMSSLSAESDHWPPEEQLQKALQAIPSDLCGTQVDQGSISLWDALQSESLPEENRNALLQTYKSSVAEVMIVCTHIIKGGATEGSTTETIIIDQEKQKSLEDATTEVLVGQFKGQRVSVWVLLNSKYLTMENKKEILVAYLSGTVTVEEIIQRITTIIEETESRSSNLKFKGLRRQVTASELLSSEIIDQSTLNELTRGSKTLEEVTQMSNVKRYLEGTSPVAGVLVPSKKDPSKKEKMSIYQAMWKQILRPGTALVLLEAQAATGFIIDPVNNKKMSVDDAVSCGVIGKELHAKLLSAERAVTGYNDPYTSEKISLFQAMKKSLIVKDHGIRLLEAQIATGGIIDPVHSLRVPVEVAYKRGYFDEEMNQILTDSSDDTKGFFDPSTHENLTYLQLLKRCVQDPETSLCMLEVKGSRSPLFQIDSALQKTLQQQTIEINVGQFQGQKFSLWELISSHHLADVEKERQELFTKYKSRSISVEELTANILLLIEGLEKKRSSYALEISSSQSLPHQEPNVAQRRVQTQSFLQSIEVDVSVGQLESRRYSLWDLLLSPYFTAGKRDELIEGYESEALGLEGLIKNIIQIIMEAEKTSVQISSRQTSKVQTKQIESIPEPVKRSLQILTISITSAEFTGESVSLWDILHSQSVTADMRQGLLHKYYLTIKGMVTMFASLSSSTVTVIRQEQDTEAFLKSVTVQVNIGEFKLEGQSHTLWELLHSKYITEEKRKTLIAQFESGEMNWEQMFNVITAIIKETEEKGRNLKFKGLRRQVTASELLKSEIIDQDTLLELTHGTKTLDEVTQMDSVKRYLEGTSCIAGLLVSSKANPSKKKKMTIYDAMVREILRPGTALVLLEAQAATGFIIDPIKNVKLTVEEAVAARVCGVMLKSKLLSAEKAVTGYTDPTTSERISLFQAMQKELIVKDHGIRLLEAQIATGGIIDPVHSHRIPVEVAYKRGYFNEEMNQILSDPSDDTKGFFDPNTHENLTYMQLLQRCVQDPESGLFLLEVSKK